MVVSLGNARAQNLTAEGDTTLETNLSVGGNVDARNGTATVSDLNFGDYNSRNNIHLRASGSSLYFSYTIHHQATGLATTNGIPVVAVLLSDSSHVIEQGDTVTIRNLNSAMTSAHGIPMTSLTGNFTVTDVNGIEIIIDVGAVATQSGTVTNFLAEVDLLVYASLDLRDRNATFFSRSAGDSAPSGVHTDVVVA